MRRAGATRPGVGTPGVFELTEASTSRRAVGVGRPIAAFSGSILAGESFMFRVTHVRLSALAQIRATHDHMLETLARRPVIPLAVTGPGLRWLGNGFARWVVTPQEPG